LSELAKDCLEGFGVYETDLQTMVRVFFQQNVELHAEVAQIPGEPGRARIRVTLVKGTIVACRIKWMDGEALSGPEALRIAERLGPLDWDYTSLNPGEPSFDTPQQNKLPRNTSAAAQSFTTQQGYTPAEPPQGTQSQNAPWPLSQPAQVPVRARDVFQQQLAEWPRTYRSVFNLVDGHNSIERIANLLRKPYETVAKILADLQKQGIIDFPTRPFN
jgi:hypothetical protein